MCALAHGILELAIWAAADHRDLHPLPRSIIYQRPVGDIVKHVEHEEFGRLVGRHSLPGQVVTSQTKPASTD